MPPSVDVENAVTHASADICLVETHPGSQQCLPALCTRRVRRREAWHPLVQRMVELNRRMVAGSEDAELCQRKLVALTCEMEAMMDKASPRFVGAKTSPSRRSRKTVQFSRFRTRTQFGANDLYHIYGPGGTGCPTRISFPAHLPDTPALPSPPPSPAADVQLPAEVPLEPTLPVSAAGAPASAPEGIRPLEALNTPCNVWDSPKGKASKGCNSSSREGGALLGSPTKKAPQATSPLRRCYDATLALMGRRAAAVETSGNFIVC